MAKELVFLQIGEYRSPENFLGKIDLLIQVPLKEKTTVGEILDVVEGLFDGNVENVAAFNKFGSENFSLVSNKTNFMEHHGFKPEPGLKLYAIFNLKTIEP